MEGIEARRRLTLSPKARAKSEKRAKAGLLPEELIDPRRTPRQRRYEMHERIVGILEPRDNDPQTDEEDEAYGVMARVDMHVQRTLVSLVRQVQ